MAAAFIESIAYTYWKVMISCISSIIMLFLIIIHIRGYSKHGQQTTTFKTKYFNTYTIVNVLTIITFFLYQINCSIIFLSKFNIIINIVSCKIYQDICAVNWQIANFSKLSVFILRLDIGFQGSQYQYSRIKLFMFALLLLFQSFINVTLHIIFQHGSKYSVHHFFYACRYEVPFYILAVPNLTDLIASSLMVYLFVKPLHILRRKDNEHSSMMNLKMTKGNISSSSQATQSATVNERALDTVVIDKLMAESQTAVYLKRIIFKYTLLTFTATLSTTLILATMSIIGNGTIVVFDYVINAFCLALLSKWYDNGHWFDRLCCGAIKLVVCCDHTCTCCKTKEINRTVNIQINTPVSNSEIETAAERYTPKTVSITPKIDNQSRELVVIDEILIATIEKKDGDNCETNQTTAAVHVENDENDKKKENEEISRLGLQNIESTHL